VAPEGSKVSNSGGQIVQDEQIESVEPVDGRLQGELASSQLQPLHEIGGSGEEHAPALLEQAQPDGGRQMRLAAPGRTQQDQIGAAPEPQNLRSHSV